MQKISRIMLLMMVWVLSSQSVFAAPRILFDEGHAQAFKVGDTGELQLSTFAELFREAGGEVVAGSSPLNAQHLKNTQALVISGPFKPLTSEEIDAVLDFVRGGGRLAVMLHIGPPLSGLLKRLGVLHSNGVIQEQVNVIEGDALNFRAQIVSPHPVTSGLETFSLYGSWALLPEGKQTEILARSSEQSWVDLNGNRQHDASDAQQAFAVLVHGRLGQGEYLVFADDAIFQNRFLHGDNLTLARNLATWLLAGPQGTLAMRNPGGLHGR